ncbi:putative hc-toxin synthetase [Phaeomoniella chlamydospora]|uniref:Putative hc-toxin synthetase n=1 Tax=Phaeomoniella chlamydospora TaxID=158046 RepID=A0A0G2GGD1_PHACM|nr:putative hc-toxin synthetase [Phaeomoniella chlamydospora]
MSSGSFSIKEPDPFSLLGEDMDPSSIRQNISAEYHIDINSIKDVYPCTSLQRDLFVASLKEHGRYTLQNVLDLKGLDEKRFCSAWSLVVQMSPILRTRIVQHSVKGVLQVVVDEYIQYNQGVDIQQYLLDDGCISTELGKPLSRYGLVTDSSKQSRWFIWSIHHSLYDGTSLPMIIDLVRQAYNNISVTKHTAFNLFVQYVRDRDHLATKAYWQAALEGYRSAAFPSLPPVMHEAKPDMKLNIHCLVQKALESGTTLATLVRAAWAIVTSHHTGSNDVVFGATVSGRHAAVVGIERIIGPTIATVPVRIQIPSTGTVAAFLEYVQTIATEMIPYEQAGLQEIAKISEDARQACGFQTLLVVQPPEDIRIKNSFGRWRVNADVQTFNIYALTLNCFLSDNGGIDTIATFDSQIIDKWLMRQLLEQFSWTVQQLANARPNQLLSNINFLPPKDRNIIWEWNKILPATIHTYAHELIEQRALSQPTAPAICAWDGELTYRDLNNLSTRLAYHLVDLGVRPEVIVPLCFEKSRWTSVAILAVLKAGGAFVLLEPSQPEARLRSVIQRLQPPVILTSIASHGLGTMLMPNNGLAVAVGLDSPQLPVALPDHRTTTLPVISPSSLMYVVFTSGSTGTPKGVMISHSAFSSAVYHQLPFYPISSDSRVFDFMSYSFDVSLQNTLATFMSGGCLCVPSDQDRKDCLADSVTRTAANIVTLTPSVLRTLEPSSLPTIRRLILIGEPIHRLDLNGWIDKVQIINTYGPSECTTASTIGDRSNNPSLIARMGKGVGAVTWIVDLNDYNILLPIGAVGELLIEGPILGRGYMDDAPATSSAFVNNPRWLLRGASTCSGRKGRLYKTGDLVHYNEDGTLTFVGRKDTQVKVRGQRVELGEVEHHVRTCVPQANDIAAEVILPTGQGASPMLAVFMTGVDDLVSGQEQSHGDKTNVNDGALVISLPARVDDRLAECLPNYMVPAVYFALTHLPMTASGKTDRKQLRQIGSTFSTEELAQLRSTVQEEKRQPTTDIQRTIQSLCAHVLNIPPASIGIDDSFFRLGGDSIAAMKLVGEARRNSIQLTVANVFRHQTIASLATVSLSLKQDLARPIEAARFSLVPSHILDSILACYRMTSGSSDISNIVDVLPITPSQRDYLLLPNKGVQQFFLDLGHDVSIAKLRGACETLIEHCAILRTQFVLYEDTHWQITLKKVPLVFKVEDGTSQCTSSVVDREKNSIVPLGASYTAFTVLHHKGYGYRLLLHISHAQYDGISLPIIIQTLLNAYHGRSLRPHTEFSAYIHLMHRQRASSASYWSNILKGSRPTYVTSILGKHPLYEGESRLVKATRLIAAPELSGNVTIASLITTAWAVILSLLSRRTDVLFGRLVAGRNGRLEGIESIPGPCHNTVPVRVLVSKETRGIDILDSVQQQHLSIEGADCVNRLDLAICLDRNEGILFDSVVKHFGFSLTPSFSVAGKRSQLQHIDSQLTTAKHIGISSYSEGPNLRLTIDARSEILESQVAQKLADALVECIEHLTTEFQEPLESWIASLDLPKTVPR